MNNNELNELSLSAFLGRNTIFNFMKTYSLSIVVQDYNEKQLVLQMESEPSMLNDEGEPITVDEVLTETENEFSMSETIDSAETVSSDEEVEDNEEEEMMLSQEALIEQLVADIVEGHQNSEDYQLN